jgi:streptolysin S family bacteriocin protoxin
METDSNNKLVAFHITGGMCVCVCVCVVVVVVVGGGQHVDIQTQPRRCFRIET